MNRVNQYEELVVAARRLFDGQRNLIANAANLSALLYHSLPELNWVGFYLFDGNSLVLGPFQGKPACSRIALGKGVCGTAAVSRQTLVVDNVHEFPGHIACDGASRAEIVVPIIVRGNLVGVLDVDSPVLARFDKDDKTGLENLVQVFIQSTDVKGAGS